VSLGRAIDPRRRARKLAHALGVAKSSGAHHVVISGDLTELGDETEFEHFAEILEAAGFDEDCVTLVPGNHDAYTANGWKKALAGPLERWRGASAEAPGKVIDRGPVALLPIDTSCFQSVVKAGGEFSPDAARAVESRLMDPALRGKAIVLVLHHAPFVHTKAPLHRFVDGLRGCAHVVDLLMRHRQLQVLHGHLHHVVDRVLGAAETRIFGAPAVCDRTDAGSCVRLYDVRDGALQSAGIV
jgi:3',5'-cyclic AMP phosphodiesterase CpdA